MRTRSLIRRRGRFPAINLLAAAGPRVRLEYMVRTPDDADVASATCAALIDAVGAGRVLQGETSRRDLRRGLAAMAAILSPDLRSLVTSVEVAHASGALPPSLRLHLRSH